MFLRRIALTLVLTAGAVMAQTTTTTSTRDFTIGPVGVGATETVQINVVNLASNATSSTGTTTAASCTGSITFNNGSGNPIGASVPFTVTAGQIYSTSLPFSKITSGTARTEVMGVVGLTTTSTNRAPCSLHFSVETFDTSTGATHVYISGAGDGIPVLQIGGGR
jgi:hypothetical protein